MVCRHPVVLRRGPPSRGLGSGPSGLTETGSPCKTPPSSGETLAGAGCAASELSAVVFISFGSRTRVFKPRASCGGASSGEVGLHGCTPSWVALATGAGAAPREGSGEPFE